MLGEGVQEVQKKVFSVWCCYLMIAAMFFWGGSFVSGEEPEIIDLDGPDGDIFKNDFASLLSDPYGSEEFGDFKLTFNGDGIFTFDRGILGGRSIHTDTLDQLRDDESFDLINSENWKSGVLTIKNQDGDKRKIFLGNDEDSVPSNIKSVEFNEDGHIMYTATAGDGEATIDIRDDGFYLKKGEGDEIIVEGTIKEVKIVTLGEGEDLDIHRDSPGEDGIHYKGQGTVINYDGIIVEPLETSTPQRSSLLTDVNGFPTFYRSSVEINEAKSMKLRNSKLVDNNKDITIDVTDTDSSLAYGYSLSELEAEVDLLNIGLGKRLYWEGGTLKGDVTWFRGAPGTLTNNGDNVIETEIAQHGGDSFFGSVSKGESLEIKNGVIHGTLGVSSRTKSSTDNQNQQRQNNEPSLPTPQNQVGKPDDSGGNNNNNGNTNGNNNNGFSPGNTGEGLPPGNTGGGGGGGGGLGGALSKMLPFLLIGGGILAAMFLFGGEDEEEEGEDNRRGSKESGNETASESGEGNGDVNTGRSTGDTGSSNEGSSSDESESGDGEEVMCDCNENGCFNCPGDDCSQCIA